MPDLLHPLNVGKVRLPNNLVLSPMAGFSDLAFRVLCRRHGAGLVCSEMVSATGVLREVPDTLLKMKTFEEETPMSIQIFGTDPDMVAQAARDVDKRCAVLGFNMGCPAHQIKKQGCGAALLDHPDLAADLVAAIKGASTKPLLVKIRLGNGSRLDETAFARSMERAGADGLIVHGRTASQGYSGKSDWSTIARIKDNIGIPVIGNGDIIDGPSAARALATGVDGIALGRATLGNPRIFGEIVHYLEHGERAPRQDWHDRLDDLRAYLDMAQAIGIQPLNQREQAQQFTRGIPGGGELRTAFTKMRNPADMIARFEAHITRDTAAPTP